MQGRQRERERKKERESLAPVKNNNTLQPWRFYFSRANRLDVYRTQIERSHGRKVFLSREEICESRRGPAQNVNLRAIILTTYFFLTPVPTVEISCVNVLFVIMIGEGNS